MGFSLSWLAVRGKQPEVVRNELRLRSAGAREECPESPITGAALPNGWYLIIENRRWRDVSAGDPVLERLSVGCEIITCSTEEHVMASNASAWKNGRKIWWLDYKGEDGVSDVQSNGDLPPEFASIHERLRKEQAADPDADCDFMHDTPIELAEVITGFRHDASSPGVTFEVLERDSWLKRIFNK